MAVETEQQISARGPAQPSYVFRGHTAQIHSARITHRNTCLVTGDADGWVVVWKLETKRPLAVWKAHEGAILGTGEWGSGKFITHGRDHTLRVWQFNTTNTSVFSKLLPADAPTTDHTKPWLLHSLPVNTLNFCSFSICYLEPIQAKGAFSSVKTKHAKSSNAVLIAVPAVDDKKVDIYRLPEERLAYVVPRIERPKDSGMVMAVKLAHHEPSNNVLVAVGYEAGLVAVHLLPRGPATDRNKPHRNSVQIARIAYLSQPHSQPVLGLDASPDGSTFYSSSADAIIAMHRIPELPPNHSEVLPAPEDVISADSQDVSSSTANLDIPRPNSTAEAPTATPSSPFQPLDFSKKSLTTTTTTASEPAGLSSLLSSAPRPDPQSPSPPLLLPSIIAPQPPHKAVNTHHSGQQSLTVRSDGRLLVTGGWDSRIRIHSAKTLKEMAVLKWHKEGVYAVDFGLVLGDEDEVEDGGEEGKVVRSGLGRLQRQREEQTQRKHWVIAGAKDGKVSLWEVF